MGLVLNPDESGFILRHEIKEKNENLVSDDGIKANAEKLEGNWPKRVGVKVDLLTRISNPLLKQ